MDYIIGAGFFVTLLCCDSPVPHRKGVPQDSASGTGKDNKLFVTFIKPGDFCVPIHEESIVFMKRCTWSATVLWDLNDRHYGSIVLQGNIPNYITPPAA